MSPSLRSISRLMSRPWWVFAIVSVLIVLLLVARTFHGKPVETLTLERATLIQTVVVSGRVTNESRVALGATITGRVASVPLREGAKVQAGSLLVQLEDREQVSALAQAEAALKVAETRLDSQRVLAAPLSRQQLVQTRANADAAKRELARYEVLFQKGFIGQSRLDEVKRTSEVARSQLQAAEAQAVANAEGAETQTVQARLTEARAAAELARAKLAQTRIVAPAMGQVLERLAEPGQIVQPGQRLMTMTIAGPTQLIAQIDEKFLAQLKVGQSASVRADAYQDQTFPATVLSIAPTVDAQRGSVEVKFAVANAPVFLRNDLTVSIEVETARRTNTLAIPSEAIRNNTALVMEGRRAIARPIKAGLRTANATEVIDGLKTGEVLILDANTAVGERVHAAPRSANREAISNAAVEGMRSFTNQ